MAESSEKFIMVDSPPIAYHPQKWNIKLEIPEEQHKSSALKRKVGRFRYNTYGYSSLIFIDENNNCITVR